MQFPEAADPRYRLDITSGQWVLLASERAHRPMRAGKPPGGGEDLLAATASCPFCEGREEQTPPETAACRAHGPANGPGWHVRAIPNRYPAVREYLVPSPPWGESLGLAEPAPKPAPVPEPERGRETDWPPFFAGDAPAGASAVLFPEASGFGHHEVIVECPEHHWSIAGYPPEQMTRLLTVFRDRLRQLQAEKRCQAAVIFKNAGRAAGATQAHAHSQLVGLWSLPPRLATELATCRQWRQRYGRRLFDDLLAGELAAQSRVVAQTPAFVAWCPFASRFPFEVWVAPRAPQSRFPAVGEAELAELGPLFHRLLAVLEKLLTPPAYNYYLHDTPLLAPARDEDYRWHLEITPRILGLAGFELGAGMYINPVPPEWAAARLREAL